MTVVHMPIPRYVYCWLLGGVNQWKKFEREWEPILRRYGVDEFHAKVFWGRDRERNRLGPYKGWSDKKRHDFIDELLGSNRKVQTYPFAYGVSVLRVE